MAVKISGGINFHHQAKICHFTNFCYFLLSILHDGDDFVIPVFILSDAIFIFYRKQEEYKNAVDMIFCNTQYKQNSTVKNKKYYLKLHTCMDTSYN